TATSPPPSNVAVSKPAAASGTPKDTLLGIPSLSTPGGEPPPNSKASMPANGPSRLPIPETSAREMAMQLVKDIFKDDYAKSTKPEDKTALADKLLTQAGQSADDATGRYVMLVEARRLAVDVGDPKILERAVAGLGKDFEIDELGELADSWEEIL